MRVDPCYFCSRPTYPGRGIQFNRNDGQSFRFCRSKCHKNFKMKRNPRKLKWTQSFRRAAGKVLEVDSTLAFGARRNIPQRYDRDLVQKTIKAMARVNEIRAKRERAFYKRRMAGNKARELARARRLVAENEHLLPRLRGSEKKRLAELGADAEDVEAEEIRVRESKSKTGKVFGGEQRRLKVRTDGGVEEIVQKKGGLVDIDEDDEDMDME